MQFFKALLLGATALAALVSAQETLQFTATPDSVTAGSPATITWTGGDASSPVTITLRKGNPRDLQTISVLTSSAIGGSYIWTPSSSLPDASDYALQITQGSAINYDGPISLAGGSAASASATSVAPTVPANSTVVSSTYSSSNASITTAPAFTGTAVSASASGYSFTRNATVSIATLKTSATGPTGAPGSVPTTAPSSGAAGVASPIALVLSAVVALCYLN